MEKLWSWSRMWQNWGSFLWLILLMQNIFMILFVKASVGNLFHLAFCCCCWGMTLFSRSLHKWEKIVKEFFFFLQKANWICDFSNLEMLRLDSNGALQCLYKEFSKFDCIQWQWMMIVFFRKLSNVPGPHASAMFDSSESLSAPISHVVSQGRF